MKDKLFFCQACLSTDRKLQSIANLETVFQTLSLWELSSNQGGVCWECLAIIKKFYNFKQNVGRVQEKLRQNKSDLTSLSTLRTQLNPGYNYNFDDDLDFNDVTSPEKNTETWNVSFQDVPKQEPDLQPDIKEEFEFVNGLQSSEDQYSDLNEGFEVLKRVRQKKIKLLFGPKKNKKDKRRPKVFRKVESDSEEVKQKFTTISFTEEEMIKNREEKRNQPNFKKIPYKCESCVLGFTRQDTFDLHLEKKHSEQAGDHMCLVCQRRFPSQKQADRHNTKHYTMYKCKLCKYETLELWSAVSHCRTKHYDDRVENIHCGCCDFIAKTPEELSQHVVLEHSVYCNECGAKFKALNTLKKHIRKIHSVKREYICDICLKTFSTKSRLESHMVNHNATIAKNLAYCGLCRVQYKNIYVYRSHLRTSANHAEKS